MRIRCIYGMLWRFIAYLQHYYTERLSSIHVKACNLCLPLTCSEVYIVFSLTNENQGHTLVRTDLLTCNPPITGVRALWYPYLVVSEDTTD